MLDLAGVAVIAALAFINLGRFDLNWDSLEYHLPFVARRAGLMRFGAFEMRDYIEARFSAYPPVVDWVQGGLWRLLGRPEAAQLVSPIAIAFLAAYARWSFRIEAIWTVATFAAIPITLTALNSSGVDVWTNAFFCIYILAVFKTFHTPPPNWPAHAGVAAAALAVCVNSKMQYFVVGGAALAIHAAAALVLAWRSRDAVARGRRLRSLGLLAVAAPLIFLSPIRNTVRFGNPIYPFAATVFGYTLPGPQTTNYVGPKRLEDVSRPARYLLSQLDFDAINHRYAGFNQDQGGQQEGDDGNRMGGALSALLIGSIAMLALGLRRHVWTLPDGVAAGAAACLLAAVMAFPGSNELRYFCFVNITITLAALAVLHVRAPGGDGYFSGLQHGLRAWLIACAVFTNFATGLRQLGAVDKSTLPAIIHAQGFDVLLAKALQESDTLCYIRPDPSAFLLSPLTNPVGRGHRYRVITRFTASQCPPGSAIID